MKNAEDAESLPLREPFCRWTRYTGYCYCGEESAGGVKAPGGKKEPPKVHRGPGFRHRRYRKPHARGNYKRSA